MKITKTFLCLALVIFINGCKDEQEEADSVKAAPAGVQVQKDSDKIDVAGEEPAEEVSVEQVEQQPVPETVQMVKPDTKVTVPDEMAIFEACFKGDVATVKAALDGGLDINTQVPDSKSTLLMLAAFDGHSELMELLIKKGCPLDAQDISGRTALIYCASGPNVSAVKLLLDAGANINIADNDEHFTALMFAAAEGQAEVVKLLLENNADWKVADIDGDTARNFAANNGHTNVVEVIDEFVKAQADSE